MTDAWRAAILAADGQIPTPKPRMANRYDAIILMGFVREWKQDGATLVPILPAMGQMPNRRQVRWVLTSEYTRLERLRQHTTAGHYLRSLRGLRGRSWEGVPGPGHTFAIDCTRGDIFLRSSVNRSWIIGRPIVYVVVDVWSTAVVGFYVCLEGPSWDTARVAIFNSSADPMLIGQLWTYDPWITLTPSPCAPYAILADRGEILSEAAAKAMFHLVPRVDYAAPYRPDMKGIVEVLIRIAKDMAYQGFVPGAIDARRAEFELRRSKPELSALTLREFVRWLHIMFATYNLTADRRSRLDAYMIGAGVVPSPAGLWRYGHELGIGYRTHTEADDLIARLLPAATGRTVAHGIDFDGALYETNVTGLGSVTAEARNFGVSEVPLHFYPGALSRIWTPRGASTGLNCLRLADTSQPADLTWYEHWDARAYATLENARWEHDRTATRVKARALNDAIVTGAKHATAEADEKMQSPRPSVQDARLAEMTGQRPATTADQAAIAEAGRSPVSPPTTPRDTPPTGDALQWYLEAMRSMADATDGSDAP
jgi:hypothetical protein